jgi:hypothetical protein
MNANRVTAAHHFVEKSDQPVDPAVGLATDGHDDPAPPSKRRRPMQYLLLIYNDPAKMQAADQGAIARAYREFIEGVTASGALRGTASWPQGTTTVRITAGKTLTTDGPYAEAREGVGGFCVIEAPDLDAAIKIAARIPSAALGGIEVRPFGAVPGGAR